MFPALKFISAAGAVVPLSPDFFAAFGTVSRINNGIKGCVPGKFCAAERAGRIENQGEPVPLCRINKSFAVGVVNVKYENV